MNEGMGMSILTLAVVAGLALSCQAGLPGAPTPTVTTPAPTSSLPPDQPGTVVPAGAEQAVALARADLARRLGLKTEAAIAVVSVEAVDWPDTSLGCPVPGMMYAQVITPGYRVTLCVSAGGQRYEYHTDQGTQAVLCQEGKRAGAMPAPTVVVTDPRVQRAVESARTDLARRLGVDPAAIVVVQVYADEFPAQDLGCPPPGTTGPTRPDQPAFVTGLEIRLAVGERQYVYRAHGSMVVYCGPG